MALNSKEERAMWSREEIIRILRKLDEKPAGDFENETLDFKRCPKLPKEKRRLLKLVLEYAVCFANKNGGTLVLGVGDDVVGVEEAVKGCGSISLDEVRRYVYENSVPNILVSCEEIEFKGKRLILVHIPKGIAVHTTTSGESKIRIGKDCIPLTGTERVRIPFARGWADFTAQFIDVLDESALDPVEIERMRRILGERAPESPLIALDDREFALNLGVLRKRGGKYIPTVAGLLVAGKEDVIKEWIPGHEIIYLRFGKNETEYEQRLDLRIPILRAIERISEAIEVRNPIWTLKMGMFHFEIKAFPEGAYREALLNALTHRDYTAPSSVFVRHYENRLEISNPGGFLEGISPENIIRAEPRWRNPLLAQIFQRLRLVERAGVGVDRMFKIMLFNGKEPPRFLTDGYSVTVILKDELVDEPFARFIREEQQKGRELSLDEVLILSALRRKRELKLKEAARILQLDDEEQTREILNIMCAKGYLEKMGRGKGSFYRLSRSIYDRLGESVRYLRERGVDEMRFEELVLEYVKNYGRITNKEVRGLLHVNKFKASRLLRKLVEKGKLVRKGESKRDVYYTLPD